ncbi:MAG: hypothetical protein K0A89_12605 [ANME-2 cluster archaeon]|nr:hypothetical protein [ANME-2 cluster archaeon]
MTFQKKYPFILLLFFQLLLAVSCSAEVGNIPDTGESQPFWSPDGQKILFSSTGVMSEGLFMIKPDGSEMMKIRTGIDTSWSPDGNIIMINIFNGSRDIVLMDIETQKMNRLTYNEKSLEEHVPKFSPNGKKIIFWGKKNSK